MEDYSSGRRGMTRNLVGHESAARVQISDPPPKNRQVSTCRFFYPIAKAMAYHHALACISSPKVHIISRRLYTLSQ